VNQETFGFELTLMTLVRSRQLRSIRGKEGYAIGGLGMRDMSLELKDECWN
jgi:hypothetical protein